jgi:hypothetical protein
VPTEGADVVLLAGSIWVPAAAAFGDSGFHEPFVLTGTVPAVAAGVPGDLVVRLRDLGRPDQTCDRDHHLTVVPSAGATQWFLSDRRGLAATPDQYAPT